MKHIWSVVFLLTLFFFTAAPAQVSKTPEPGKKTPAQDVVEQINIETLDATARMAALDSLIRKKKYKTVEVELKKWIDKDPLDDALKIKLAGLYETKKMFQDATDIYEKLVYRTPKNSAYLKKLIGLFKSMRLYSVAVKYCDRYLELEPNTIEVLEQKAFFLTQEKRSAEAVAAYLAILSVAPQRNDIQLQLAQEYLNTKQYSEARTIYTGLLQGDPQNVDYKRGLAMVLYADQKYQEAEKNMRDVLLRNPKDYEMIDLYCQLLAHEQRYDEALNYYYRLLQSDPLDVQVKWRIARIYAWKGDYFTALNIYDQLIKTFRVSREIVKERARVLGWAHKYEASMDQYQKLVEDEPADSLTRLEAQARRDLYEHRYTASISGYRRLTDADHDNWDAKLQLAQLYTSFERWDYGRNQYQDIMNTMPTFERVRVAINKLDLISSHINAAWDASYLYAKSGDEYNPGKLKLNSEIYRTAATAALPPLAENLTLAARYNFDRHHFERANDRSVNRMALSARYTLQPAFWCDGSFTHAQVQDGNAHNLVAAAANYRLSDLHLFSAEFNTREFYPNDWALARGLEQQIIGAGYTLQLSKRMQAGVLYQHLNYNDSLANTQNVIAGNLKYSTLLRQAGVSYEYCFRYTGSRYSSAVKPLAYFAAENWFDTYLTLEWMEFIKGYDFYWGQDKVFYTLAYTCNVDRDVIFTNSLRGALNMDISPQLNVRLDGLLGTSTRHQERQAGLKMLYYF